MAFRTGRIAKEGLHPRLHKFAPARTVTTLQDIRPNDLFAEGKRLILLDADNTLLPWRSEDVPAETLTWLEEAKQAGCKLCLVSNTRNRERLNRLSLALGVEVAEGKFKPSREMYRFALEKFQVLPEEAVMIGDQIFTDVWGANRAGIESILLKPMARKEFIGTKVNRIGEWFIWKRLHDAMEEELDDLPIVEPSGFFQRRVVRQFAKFCIVGLTSFAIDYNVRMTLQFQTTWGGELLSARVGEWLQLNMPFFFAKFSPAEAFFPVAAATGAALAIVNSFIWNRFWTFGVRGKDEAATQFAKFLAISLTGLCLNVLVSSTIIHLLPGDPKNNARIATVLAAGVVAFWNFFGQRLYAFRSGPSGGQS